MPNHPGEPLKVALGALSMPRPVVKSVPAKTRRGWVVKSILRSIFAGEFAGGDRLVEEELAMTLGVSRTPIREALGELAGIGVIDVKPNHGAVVRPFGAEQVREMYHVRRILEAEATRLATGRIDPAILREIRQKTEYFLNQQTTDETESSDAMAVDQRFHELISANCGVARLAEEIDRYRALVHFIRVAIGSKEHALDVARSEHIRMIDLMLDGKSDEAAEMMNQHIIRGTESAVAALFDASRARLPRQPRGVSFRSADVAPPGARPPKSS